MERFRAWVIREQEKRITAGFEDWRIEELDAGEVLIAVRYSSVNYKDALASTGRGKIVRRFPMIGGIDLAGEVLASEDPRFRPGDRVIATGFGLGVEHHGGYAERARLPASWVVPLPAGLTLWEAMALGTAGFTAALALMRLEQAGLTPDSGPVAVTGASGGVGMLAVQMLAQRRYEVIAISGKREERDRLASLGASSVWDRSALDFTAARPLEKGLFAAAIDNLGGAALHWLLAHMKQGAAVAAVGNALSAELATTVFPFILRGVSLLGVDSVNTPSALRAEVWLRLATDLKPHALEAISRTIAFDEVAAAFEALIAGRGRGRLVVQIA